MISGHRPVQGIRLCEEHSPKIAVTARPMARIIATMIRPSSESAIILVSSHEYMNSSGRVLILQGKGDLS